MKELTLYIICATNGNCGELTHVYARDEQHARGKARYWLEERMYLPEHTVKAFPDGFQIVASRLPGKIKVPDEQG